jgi:hypothetical protein
MGGVLKMRGKELVAEVCSDFDSYILDDWMLKDYFDDPTSINGCYRLEKYKYLNNDDYLLVIYTLGEDKKFKVELLSFEADVTCIFDEKEDIEKELTDILRVYAETNIGIMPS